MLTKKDFEAVAEIIAEDYACYNGPGGAGICGDVLADISDKLADYFATQNPRFDRERFMKACGLEN